jgi:hypothetical protein
LTFSMTWYVQFPCSFDIFLSPQLQGWSSAFETPIKKILYS